MSSSPVPIDVARLIDESGIGRYQLMIFVLAGLAVVMDGFDVQAMSFVAPAVIREFGVNKALMGPVFGAALSGMLLGSLGLSVLADRIGRRPVLIGASVFFAVCMLCTTFAANLTQLQAIRFVTGVALGAVMPNAMALAGEFSPARRRATVMMLVSGGFTIGALAGGLLSALTIPAFGWRSVFWFGAGAPLVLALSMIAALPESLHFLVLRKRDPDAVTRCLCRIVPGFSANARTRYFVGGAAKSGAMVDELFRQGRAPATLLLWFVQFMNLLSLYFLSSWLPIIAASAGLSIRTAVLVGAALQAGGVLGPIVIGPLIDRFGFNRMLVPSYALAAVTIALIGQPGMALPLLLLVVTVTGFCIIGGQAGVNALAASYYPTTLRSTGIGWSLGIGRIGSIIGPVLGGELIARNWPNSYLFLAVAMPAAVSAIALLVMAMTVGQRGPTIEETTAQ